jgi:Zn-dependent protease with chaperone function
VPLLLVLIQAFTLGLAPLEMAYSRAQEHEADRFALELTQRNHSAATAFVKMQQDNLGVPWHGPVYKLFRGSHPSIGERIVFCNTYHPWTYGERLFFEGYFQPSPELPKAPKN